MAEDEMVGVSRRGFLQMAGAVTGGITLGALAGCEGLSKGGRGGMRVVLHREAGDVVANSGPGRWAMGRLRDVLVARGVNVVMTMDKGEAGDFVVYVMGKGPKGAEVMGAESQAIVPKGERGVIAAGADARGLVYALTELADRVEMGRGSVVEALRVAAPIREERANGIRGVFRMFVSEVEDKRWFYDREGWRKYFDMLVSQRFNRFNLSFGLSYDFSRGLTDTYTFFMYPFFVDVAGYEVKAVGRDGVAVSGEEMAKNLETLKFISDEAALRGLDFNLGIWTHNYSWPTSPMATHTIRGLDAGTQAPYSRDAMRKILETCPGITGVTLRTHGESGVPEGSYDLWKVIMSGVTGLKRADGTARVVELDLHGKTMTAEMIETALGTGMPLTISCKFWAEHLGLPYVQASIRETEMPKGGNGRGLMALSSGSRSFMRYGVGDLLTKGRRYKVIHRVWPGTQRVLLWGDPLYAAGYGRAGSFGGMDGIEYFEPLSFKGRGGSSMGIAKAADRSGYADGSLRSEREWEKYLYTFRLWGRLSYNPEADGETWRRGLWAEFGGNGAHYEAALGSASRILPLVTTAHAPCASNYEYWPEMYVNMSLYDTTKVGSYGEVANPKVFGNVSSLDPAMFASIFEFVEGALAGRASGRVSPLEVAGQLERWSWEAREALGRARFLKGNARGAEDRRMAADILIAAGIGEFFAQKLRAGVLWEAFMTTGEEAARKESMRLYGRARDAWENLSEAADVYLPDLTYGPERQLRKHWRERLGDMDTDIAGMAEHAAKGGRGGVVEKGALERLMAEVELPRRMGMREGMGHRSAGTFQAGEEVALEVRGVAESVRLFYRHVNQGERYVVVEMKREGERFSGAIPGAYTEGKFDLEYYFEGRLGREAWMIPGFGKEFMGMPYFVLRQA